MDERARLAAQLRAVQEDRIVVVSHGAGHQLAEALHLLVRVYGRALELRVPQRRELVRVTRHLVAQRKLVDLGARQRRLRAGARVGVERRDEALRDERAQPADQHRVEAAQIGLELVVVLVEEARRLGSGGGWLFFVSVVRCLALHFLLSLLLLFVELLAVLRSAHRLELLAHVARRLVPRERELVPIGRLVQPRLHPLPELLLTLLLDAVHAALRCHVRVALDRFRLNARRRRRHWQALDVSTDHEALGARCRCTAAAAAAAVCSRVQLEGGARQLLQARLEVGGWRRAGRRDLGRLVGRLEHLEQTLIGLVQRLHVRLVLFRVSLMFSSSLIKQQQHKTTTTAHK